MVPKKLPPADDRIGFNQVTAIDRSETVDVDHGEGRVIAPVGPAPSGVTHTNVVNAVLQATMGTGPPFIIAIRGCDMPTTKPYAR